MARDKFNEQDARDLAQNERYYVAKKIPRSEFWGVWDSQADHWVEFDVRPSDALGRLQEIEANRDPRQGLCRTPRRNRQKDAVGKKLLGASNA